MSKHTRHTKHIHQSWPIALEHGPLNNKVIYLNQNLITPIVAIPNFDIIKLLDFDINPPASLWDYEYTKDFLKAVKAVKAEFGFTQPLYRLYKKSITKYNTTRYTEEEARIITANNGKNHFLKLEIWEYDGTTNKPAPNTHIYNLKQIDGRHNFELCAPCY